MVQPPVLAQNTRTLKPSYCRFYHTCEREIQHHSFQIILPLFSITIVPPRSLQLRGGFNIGQLLISRERSSTQGIEVHPAVVTRIRDNNKRHTMSLIIFCSYSRYASTTRATRRRILISISPIRQQWLMWQELTKQLTTQGL